MAGNENVFSAVYNHDFEFSTMKSLHCIQKLLDVFDGHDESIHSLNVICDVSSDEYETESDEETISLVDGIVRFVKRDVSCQRGFKSNGKLNVIARAILQGVYDDECSLSIFRGMLYIVKDIYEWNNAFNVPHYRNSIKISPMYFTDDSNVFDSICNEAREYFYSTNKYGLDPNEYPNLAVYSKFGDHWEWIESGEYESLSRQYLENAFEPIQYFAADHQATFNLNDFPEPTGINVNMMPFIMNDQDFGSLKLPKYLEGYAGMILKVARYCHKEHGKVCYLTIDESFVDEEHSQRRPGLHIETPGVIHVDGMGKVEYHKAKGGYNNEDICVSWGGGTDGDNGREGGIYMSCNMDRSCEIWNCRVDENAAIGKLGDLEHLRTTLKDYGVHRQYMRAGRLYWITDRTPHESLPVRKSGVRQFFRIVTSQLSLWYAEHSTSNPLGVVPDPAITKIVYGSKFN